MARIRRHHYNGTGGSVSPPTTYTLATGKIGGTWRGGPMIGMPGNGGDLATAGYEWFYNYTPSNGYSTSVPFVPMVYNEADVPSAPSGTPSDFLLTFNEPDAPGANQIDVPTALSHWPTLLATGRQLGSPAVRTGSNTWRQNFLKGCQDNGYRVDFICVHWYQEGGTAADLVNYLNTVHTNAASAAQYGQELPIWLTEFSAYNGTVAANTSLVQNSGPQLAKLPFLHRIGWFCNRSIPGGAYANCGLVQPGGGALTSVGTAYKTIDSNYGTGGGDVLDNGASIIGTKTYNAGSVVHPTANPDSTSQFIGWGGALTGTTNPGSITMNSNKILTATFNTVPTSGGGGGGGNPWDTGLAAIDTHMGNVVKADLAATQDPCPNKWYKITDPYIYGPYDATHPATADPYVKWLTSPLDTHIPVGQSAVSGHIRQCISDPAVQDLFDQGKNQSTRTQMIANNTNPNTTFWVGTEGTRYWYMFSLYRFGTGILTSSGMSQLTQWKAPTTTAGTVTQPIMAMDETATGALFRHHDWLTGDKTVTTFDMPNHVWCRFWVDITWSADFAKGQYSVYTDAPTGDGTPTKLLGPVTGQRTLFFSSQGSNWSWGTYLSPASDANSVLHLNGANFQVANYKP